MSPERDRAGRLLPTGICWCGCDEPTKERGNFFLAGHDRVAESAIVNMKYGGVAEFMVEHGYGPGLRNARAEVEEWRSKGGTIR